MALILLRLSNDFLDAKHEQNRSQRIGRHNTLWDFRRGDWRFAYLSSLVALKKENRFIHGQLGRKGVRSKATHHDGRILYLLILLYVPNLYCTTSRCAAHTFHMSVIWLHSFGIRPLTCSRLLDTRQTRAADPHIDAINRIAISGYDLYDYQLPHIGSYLSDSSLDCVAGCTLLPWVVTPLAPVTR